MSFTPWHGVKDIEPVGRINRLRKAVYDSVSRYRHGKNGVKKKNHKVGVYNLMVKPAQRYKLFKHKSLIDNTFNSQTTSH